MPIAKPSFICLWYPWCLYCILLSSISESGRSRGCASASNFYDWIYVVVWNIKQRENAKVFRLLMTVFCLITFLHVQFFVGMEYSDALFYWAISSLYCSFFPWIRNVAIKSVSSSGKVFFISIQHCFLFCILYLT